MRLSAELSDAERLLTVSEAIRSRHSSFVPRTEDDGQVLVPSCLRRVLRECRSCCFRRGHYDRQSCCLRRVRMNVRPFYAWFCMNVRAPLLGWHERQNSAPWLLPSAGGSACVLVCLAPGERVRSCFCLAAKRMKAFLLAYSVGKNARALVCLASAKMRAFMLSPSSARWFGELP
ncbi:unnamed protein product [Microthlaspi erraticum]|uniref:Uncharacterized protein n=2 Tax=Microthlaspi erraticum TaxID=1685480 RepID=A0A6D2HPD7_9BRAS|nr:unnamed protein product [Microthlaspi erraticum]